MNASAMFYEKDRVAIRDGGPKGTVMLTQDPDTVVVKFDGWPVGQAVSMKQLRRLPPHEAGETRD